MSSKNEITVSKDGNGDYTSINEAIANADKGSKIFVKSGEYEEFIEINKNVTIIGDQEEYPEIFVDNGCVCKINSDCSLSNLFFSNSNYEKEYLLDSDDYNEIIDGDDNLEHKLGFTENGNAFGLIEISSKAKIENCIINYSKSAGIVVTDGNPKITSCTIEKTNLIGVYINGGNPVFKDCIYSLPKQSVNRKKTHLNLQKTCPCTAAE